MRVLKSTPYWGPDTRHGGPPEKILALALRLTARGTDVTIAAPNHLIPAPGASSVGAAHLSLYGVQCLRTRPPIPLDLLTVRRLVGWADVVHCYGTYGAFTPLMGLTAASLRVPFVVEPLGMLVPRGSSIAAKRLFGRIVLEPVLKLAARVVVTSRAEWQDAASVKVGGKLRLRPNGIDPPEKTPDPRALRRRLGIGQHRRIVLFLGRLSPIKNLATLIDAFSAAGIHDALLVLAGPIEDNAYRRALLSRIVGLGLSDRVVLTGPIPRDEKWDVLAGADILVLPSTSESFGMVAAEATCVQVPCLLTKGCGIAENLGGVSALVVDPTCQGLAAGLRALLAEPGLLPKLRSRCSSAAARLSWEKAVDTQCSIYEEVVAGRSSSSPT